jgi:ArsR family transcriptional regulator
VNLVPHFIPYKKGVLMEKTDFMTDEESRVDEYLPQLVKDTAMVTQAVKSLPPDGDLNNLCEFFKVLTDPTRLKILYALGTGELCVFDLSVSVGSSVSSVSHHLAALKRTRLVKMRRDGRVIYYSLDDEHVKSIIKFAWEHLEEE